MVQNGMKGAVLLSLIVVVLGGCYDEEAYRRRAIASLGVICKQRGAALELDTKLVEIGWRLECYVKDTGGQWVPYDKWYNQEKRRD